MFYLLIIISVIHFTMLTFNVKVNTIIVIIFLCIMTTIGVLALKRLHFELSQHDIIIALSAYLIIEGTGGITRLLKL